MNVAASIAFSMGISALWAVTFAVAAYCTPVGRRIRPLLLAAGLFLVLKDSVALAAAGENWLPAESSRAAIYELYRAVMALSGAALLTVLLVRSGRAAQPKAKEISPATPPPAFQEEMADDDSLLSRFQHLLFDGQLFLRPQLTLPEVADMLHTNKTYVSKLVNDHYKVSFPELINTLRVDYAEQFILNNRDARQEEVARACGFLSASSFNNTFKKVTGMPPKQWVTHWDAGHRE